MCNKGFMKLLSIGKQRFATMISSLKSGSKVCPLDKRYMPRAPLPQTPKRAAIHDFLFGLYEHAAETLPDLHHSSSNKRPRQGKLKFDDTHLDRSKLRFLPPGKIMDYLRLCRAENPDMTISSKLFSSASASFLNT